MKEIVRHGKRNGIDEIAMGMAHRGRLNMLVNVLGKNHQNYLMNLRGNTMVMEPVM